MTDFKANYDSILGDIKLTLDGMLQLKDNNVGTRGNKLKNYWYDNGNRIPGTIMTCEAIETFIIPYLRKYPGIDKNYLISAGLKDDVRYLLEVIKSDNFKFLGEESYEYYFPMYTQDDTNREFVEKASFILCALIHTKIVNKRDPEVFQGVDKDFFRDIDLIIQKAIDFICRVYVNDPGREDVGFKWGDSAPRSQLYFTWAVIEALSEALEYKEYTAGYKYDQMSTMCANIRSYYDEVYLTSMCDLINKASLDKEGNVIKPEECFLEDDGRSNIANNIYVILILLLLGPKSPEKLGICVNFLASTFSKSFEDYHIEGNIVPLKGTDFKKMAKPTYKDRSVFALFLKTIPYAFLYRVGNEQSNLEILLRLYGIWKGCRSTKYKGLWDNVTPTIYITERTMEAMNRIALFFRHKIEEDEKKFTRETDETIGTLLGKAGFSLESRLKNLEQLEHKFVEIDRKLEQKLVEIDQRLEMALLYDEEKIIKRMNTVCSKGFKDEASMLLVFAKLFCSSDAIAKLQAMYNAIP